MNTSTPLLTDLYQLTMAAGYWKSGKAEQDAGVRGATGVSVRDATSRK